MGAGVTNVHLQCHLWKRKSRKNHCCQWGNINCNSATDPDRKSEVGSARKSRSASLRRVF
jgi:hypothetical protein